MHDIIYSNNYLFNGNLFDLLYLKILLTSFPFYLLSSLQLVLIRSLVLLVV
jgi:hypothetical protein